MYALVSFCCVMRTKLDGAISYSIITVECLIGQIPKFRMDLAILKYF
jgi:hypothetical protein